MLRSKAWSGHSSLRPPPSRDGAGRSAFTFGAVLPTAFFTGQGPHARDYKRGTTLRVDKGVGAKYLELRISDKAGKLQPEFVVKVWE